MKIFIMHFSPTSSYIPPLRSKYSSQLPVPKPLNIYLSHGTTRTYIQASTGIQTHGTRVAKISPMQPVAMGCKELVITVLDGRSEQ
jgi:hypothetical protein